MLAFCAGRDCCFCVRLLSLISFEKGDGEANEAPLLLALVVEFVATTLVEYLDVEPAPLADETVLELFSPGVRAPSESGDGVWKIGDTGNVFAVSSPRP